MSLDSPLDPERPTYASLPAELISCARWILWKFELAADNDKPTKVPYAVDGRRASTTDQTTWSTYERSRKAVARCGAAGIGFVFVASDDILGIDLDHVIDAKGKIKPWARTVIEKLNSYTEISPSGTGFHIFIRGTKPAGSKCNLRFPGGEGFECYDSGRYFTVTGTHVARTPSEVRSVSEDVLVGVLTEMEARLPKKKPASGTTSRALPNAVSFHDDELLRHMFSAKNGAAVERLYRGHHNYGSPSEADIALCGRLAFWTGCDRGQMDRLFRASGLMRDKWDTRHGENTYGERTITTACENCSETYSYSNVVPITTRRDPPPAKDEKRVTRPKGSGGTNGTIVNAIDVTQCDLPVLTTLAITELETWNSPPTFFRQNAEAVRVQFDENEHAIIKPVTVPVMRHALANAAKFIKVRKTSGECIDVEPPKVIVENVLATPYLPLPGLRGIASAPFFTATGTLVVKSGYNLESQLYLSMIDVEVPAISEAPTAEQLADAVEAIDDIFADFPFKGDADRAHAFAILLLPFVREMISGPTPLHLVNAPNMGTGKSLLSQTALIPACGNVAATTFGRDEEEQRKKIFTLLKGGRPAVLLDNLHGTLNSASLAAVLTQTVYTDRALGGHEQPEVINRAVWVATSNNAKLSEEITRRTISIRLDAQVEKPFDRDQNWRHPNLLKFAGENRGKLIAAALTIVQAWIAAKRPGIKRKPLGSYEAWSHVIGGTLAHAGVLGFLSNVEQLFAAADGTGEALRAFVADWATAYGEQNVTAKDLLPLALTAGVDLGYGEDSSKLSKLGKSVLLANEDRIFGGYRVDKRYRAWGLVQMAVPGDTAGSVGSVGSPTATSGENIPIFPTRLKGKPYEPYGPCGERDVPPTLGVPSSNDSEEHDGDYFF